MDSMATKSEKSCPQHGKGCRRVERTSNFVRCGWCGYLVETTNPVQFCSGCYVNYRIGRDYIHFDKDYKPFNNEAYAWAKAFAKAGGVRIGSDDSWEENNVTKCNCTFDR